MVTPTLPKEAQAEFDAMAREYTLRMHVQEYDSALATITRLLEKMLYWQKEYRRRFHKGYAIHNIGFTLIRQQKKPEDALKYFILAYIEDLISADNENEADLTPAGRTLLEGYRFDPGLLSVLKQKVRKLKEENNIPLRPEEVLQEAQAEKGYKDLLGKIEVTGATTYEANRETIEFVSAGARGIPPVGPPGIPIEIQESLAKFTKDYPEPRKVAFIMMQFSETSTHTKISEAIKSALRSYGIAGVRADEKCYHEHLFFNVLTYMHGCALGIAVFERIEKEEPNPNVSFEVGYMFALGKPVCLLKDRTLKILQSDLVGMLYRPFDTQNPMKTISEQIAKWLSDKGII